jgi:hypothetical protein
MVKIEDDGLSMLVLAGGTNYLVHHAPDLDPMKQKYLHIGLQRRSRSGSEVAMRSNVG